MLYFPQHTHNRGVPWQGSSTAVINNLFHMPSRRQHRKPPHGFQILLHTDVPTSPGVPLGRRTGKIRTGRERVTPSRVAGCLPFPVYRSASALAG